MPGDALHHEVRQEAERSFGQDLSSVRIHTGSKAQQAAASVEARAFTAEHHIVFAEGEYRPNTINGRLILAHELVHAAQNSVIASSGTPAQLAIARVDTASGSRQERTPSLAANPATERADLSVAGVPRDRAHPSVLADTVEKMNLLLGKIGAKSRRTIRRNKAIAIGVALEGKTPVFVYSATDDWVNERVTGALKELGVRRLQGYREKHEGSLGAHWHAEQIMLAQAHERGLKIVAMAVAGQDVCPDCAMAIEGEPGGWKIQVAEVAMSPEGGAGSAPEQSGETQEQERDVPSPATPEAEPAKTRASQEGPTLTASHETIEPFSRAPADKPESSRAEAMAGAAAQVLADIDEALQREAVVRDARRAGSLRTYRWWLQMGIEVPARAVYDRWFTKDESDTGPEGIARRVRSGRFSGMDVGRISTPEQYEQFETWVRNNVNSWDDLYRHFVLNEDAGVLLRDGQWTVISWEWGDWWPANSTRVVGKDQRIAKFMEHIRAGIFAKTGQEIAALPSRREALGTGDARVAGVRKFRMWADRYFYSVADQIPLLVGWTFDPVFYEISGVAVASGYTLVSGADIPTYEMIYTYRATYDRSARPATVSDPSRIDDRHPYTGWGSVTVPCILVRTESLAASTSP